MKIGTVTARGTSPKGKPTIHVDGQLYYAGGTPLAGLTVGDKIEFDCSSFGERGDLWGINKGWKLLEGAHKYPPPQQPSTPAASHERPSAAVEHAKAMSEAELRFISNCVGSAITAKTLTDPELISKWVAAAKNALREQNE